MVNVDKKFDWQMYQKLDFAKTQKSKNYTYRWSTYNSRSVLIKNDELLKSTH